MNLGSIKEKIGEENVRENEVLAPYTSMKVGGPARYFFTPKTSEDLSFLLKELKKNGVKYYVLGNATNVIVKDEGYDGAIIKILNNMSRIEVKGEVICAQAGASLKEIAGTALENGLSGFEFASGIPGSLGGAVTMNAGAYGGEMKDVIISVTAMDVDGNIKTFSNEEADLSYRHSAFSAGKWIVLEAELKLSKGNPSKIKELMEDLSQKRSDKQPLDVPSCGSTFKRPEGYFAGKLIMDSGLKGARVGGASVSTKHAGFVVNDKNGTAKDVLAVIELVKKTVLEKQGVELQCEVRVL